MNILHIDSSPLGPNSASRSLTRQIVAQLSRDSGAVKVVYRDLSANPIRHWDSAAIAATDAGDAASESAVSDTLMREFLAADVIVIGAPMYNFAVPTQLKAWIDRIAVAGKTFRYTAEGPVGLAGGRRVIVASTRGGIYSTTEGGRALDHQESWLAAVFGFIGIRGPAFDIVRAEGLALSAEARTNALQAAAEQIAQLPRLPAAMEQRAAQQGVAA